MILFACENAGPAKYFVPLIQSLKDKVEITCWASCASQNVFRTFGIPALARPTARDSFEKFQIIILGTCLDDQGLDKSLLSECKGLPVKVVVAFEQWCHYRRRLTINDKFLLPDAIIVNDEIALREASAEGIPKTILHPLGNPWLELLAQKQMACAPRRSKRSSGNKFLFISEEYEKEFPRGTSYDQGFTEFEALEDILPLLSITDRLVIKLHPSEPVNKYDLFIQKSRKWGIPISIQAHLDLERMVQNYDFIIGLGSMLLIELSFFRPDIISYRPRQLVPFIGNKLKATHYVDRPSDLKEIFEGRKVIHNSPPARQYNGSTQSIIRFLFNQGFPNLSLGAPERSFRLDAGDLDR